MSDIAIKGVLEQMRAITAQAQGGNLFKASEPLKAGEFSTLLKSALDQVNETQKHAESLAQAVERGDPKVDLADAMIAGQKASISFQAAVQVRNKLVSAYQDIMNMPI